MFSFMRSHNHQDCSNEKCIVRIVLGTEIQWTQVTSVNIVVELPESDLIIFSVEKLCGLYRDLYLNPGCFLNSISFSSILISFFFHFHFHFVFIFQGLKLRYIDDSVVWIAFRWQKKCEWKQIWLVEALNAASSFLSFITTH